MRHCRTQSQRFVRRVHARSDSSPTVHGSVLWHRSVRDRFPKFRSGRARQEHFGLAPDFVRVVPLVMRVTDRREMVSYVLLLQRHLRSVDLQNSRHWTSFRSRVGGTSSALMSPQRSRLENQFCSQCCKANVRLATILLAFLRWVAVGSFISKFIIDRVFNGTVSQSFAQLIF